STSTSKRDVPVMSVTACGASPSGPASSSTAGRAVEIEMTPYSQMSWWKEQERRDQLRAERRRAAGAAAGKAASR
ncbi:MAG TPA: hypothetical protein VMU75_14990, partial [Acidimicrobiales bacterium]|nr:hypothetical protein [Acidimicrobiales bacterium]